MNLYKSPEQLAAQGSNLTSISAIIKESEINCALLQSDGKVYSLDHIDCRGIDNAEKMQIALSHIEVQCAAHGIDKTNIAIDTPLFTLVPDELYNVDEDVTYFRNIGYMTFKDQIVRSGIAELESQYLYCISKPILEDIQNRAPNVSLFHYGNILLKDFISLRDSLDLDSCMFCYVSDKSIYLGVFKNRRLQLFNRFQIASSQDFLYYVLLCFSKFEMDRDESPLVLCGKILPEGEMIKLVNQYVRKVQMVDKSWHHYIKDLNKLEHPQFYQDLYALGECA